MRGVAQVDIRQRRGDGQGYNLAGSEIERLISVKIAAAEADISEDPLSPAKLSRFREMGLILHSKRDAETVEAASFHGRGQGGFDFKRIA
jgi:hypothetical protein